MKLFRIATLSLCTLAMALCLGCDSSDSNHSGGVQSAYTQDMLAGKWHWHEELVRSNGMVSPNRSGEMAFDAEGGLKRWISDGWLETLPITGKLTVHPDGRVDGTLYVQWFPSPTVTVTQAYKYTLQFKADGSIRGKVRMIHMVRFAGGGGGDAYYVWKYVLRPYQLGS